MKEPLSVLEKVELLITSEKSNVQANGMVEYWQRDMMFLAAFRESLLSGDPERLHWVFDQMRNLSQGFGSYCSDLKLLDSLIDCFYAEMTELIAS
ncbi:MAG: hypothetical protein J0L75_08235 [Spirochaetes bacterium]|nr:hypothetical protein [Spirochaetota bacterium]